MTEINPCGWLQNAGSTHTAAQMRTYFGAVVTGLYQASSITRTAGGVHPGLGGQLAVSQNGTPNMSVNVAAGVAFIPGTESTAQGVYTCENDATVNKTIATAPGTGLSRIDLVVAKVEDSFYSGSTNAWSLAVVTGTAASTPSAPTAPSNSITLAQVNVGANVTSITTSDIVDERPFAAGMGALQRSTSTTHPSVPYTGMQIYETDTQKMAVYNGTSWTYDRQIGAWTSYTPTWFATTTNPTIGNGSIQGRYAVFGKTIFVRGRILWGSSTTNGNGFYTIGNFPFNSEGTFDGMINLRFTQGSTHQPGWGYMATGGAIMTPYTLANSGTDMDQAAHSIPWVWASGNSMWWWGTYEAA